jgi:glutamine amidotransferase
VAAALKATLKRVREICNAKDAAVRPLLTVIVTDGDTMVASHGGKELYWSSYKTRCSDRDVCPSLSAECEAPSRTGFVNHLIFSSEPLQGENIWLPLEEGDVLGVDWRMRVLQTRIDRVALPVAAQ